VPISILTTPSHRRVGLPRAALTLLLCLLGHGVMAQTASFRWAGDAEGGAPFVEADPSHPDMVVGFDVEVAGLLARGLGREPQFVQITFSSIDQSIARGDADVGLSGVEDTLTRRAALSLTIPYYEFREVLAVRTSDTSRFRNLADLRGRRIGTLSGTIAYDLLLRAERVHGIEAVSYDDDVHPYTDLVLGRVDAVLLDHVLAERRLRVLPGFSIQPEAVAVGHYVGAFALEQGRLRDTCDGILRAAMRDGSLERIFRKWGVWSDDQGKLYARLLAGESIPPVSLARISGMKEDALESAATISRSEATERYMPSLLRASVITLVLSCLSMALAVAIGIMIATGRVYGGRVMRTVLIAYVELMRGTPILLQLFVLYYGIAEAIRLPASRRRSWASR
jgi:polar amino acid transport system substrate-binding protein